MDARDFIKIGMSAERTLVVPAERTVGHFVPGMPMVYATPMMILEMEMASSDAIRPCLQPGWITVGWPPRPRPRQCREFYQAAWGEVSDGRYAPVVMRGLDPRIHQRIVSFYGLPGQARQ